MTAPSLVVENTLPGVSVLINQAQVARPIKRQPTSTSFIVVYTPWGPVNVPRIITSWNDYAGQFGGFDANSFGDDFAHVFFNVFPGKQVWVNRVVGPAAAKATVTIKDRGVGAALKDTLRIDAKYPSSRVDIRYKIEAGTQADTVKLTVRSIFLNRKERFDNFRMDAASIDNVNQKSKLVDFTNLNSTNAAPVNLPALTAEATLAGGDDDFAGVTAATYVGADDGTTKTGLQTFNDEYLGTGQVAIPGITDDTAHAALLAHGEKYHRLALLDPALGSDKQDLLDIREEIGTWYAALYWPWVEMLDFEGTGLKKFYPPSCFAAGACAKVDREIGTHKAPANVQIPGALGVEKAFNGQSQTDDNTRELLNGKDINVITPLPEQGVKIYGARVLTGDRRVQMVHEIRMLNLFYYSAKIGYQWAVFQVVDPQGRLFRDLVATGVSF
ncbi:MAG TPA: phage tail sheath subtilisin-like domain-containing protein, partial [Blastocatellia bacterium]